LAVENTRDLLEKYRDLVNVLTVYIQEAHASDQWPLGKNVVIPQHQILEDRLTAALMFQQNMNYDLPLVVDTMENKVNETYAIWPERAYIFVNGIIDYITPPTLNGEINWEEEIEDWLISYFDQETE